MDSGRKTSSDDAPEIFDSRRDSVGKRDSRMPAEPGFGEGDVRLALSGIVRWQAS